MALADRLCPPCAGFVVRFPKATMPVPFQQRMLVFAKGLFAIQPRMEINDLKRLVFRGQSGSYPTRPNDRAAGSGAGFI
jgi:hypothetical protein